MQFTITLQNGQNIINNIPNDTTQLTIQNLRSPGNTSAAEIGALLGSLNPSVTHLILSNLELFTPDLDIAFNNLKPSVTHLSLEYGKINSGNKTIGLINILNKLNNNTNITYLCLKKISFIPVQDGELIEVIKAIPRQLTHLDLSYTKLGEEPEFLGFRRISANDVYCRNIDAITNAFANLPPSLTHLNLDGNNLNYLQDRLEKYFKQTQPNAIALILSRINPEINISLGDNQLFNPYLPGRKKNFSRTDKYLEMRSRYPRIDFAGRNGESDAQRALAPLSSWLRSNSKLMRTNDFLPFAIKIISYLFPENVPLLRIRRMFVDAYRVIEDRNLPVDAPAITRPSKATFT